MSSFYLHSNKNRRLYPSIKYPLTHFLDSQSIRQRLSKQPTYVKHFKYTFGLLLLFILISTTFFRVHIYVYNSFFGPFHQNFNEFLEHIKNFENGQSWLKRIEYIQIELGENNIISPSSTHDTIRKYSDPFTRRNQIATYKKANKPNIYIKLPARSQKNFHAHHSFHFSSYSIRTLQCIVKHLQSSAEATYNTWLEKSEYVKYINEEYRKNSTLFNILVLTKCGILIGYLYRPVYDKAFISTKEYTFYANDIAFDATRPYCFFIPLLVCSFIFTWLFLKALFYLSIYLFNTIRYKLSNKIPGISFPLNISANVINELWLLNLQGAPHEQLLQLDELIQQSKHQFNEQLFIIQNDLEQLCVIFLQTKLYEESFIQNELSPFIICPVTDIRKIVQYGGVCYGEDSSWIPWPSTMTDEENFSEWLHVVLMEISEDYKNQYEYRLQNEGDNRIQPSWNYLNSRSYSNDSDGNQIHRRRNVVQTETPDEAEIKQFIREEENFQHLRLERQPFFERIFEQSNPASSRFIANFRMQQQSKKNLVDSAMEKQDLNCMICFSEFQLNESYERWPCPSATPHIFHFECMWNMLRRKNTCPICRHPVEAAQPENDTVSQFLRQLAF